MVEQPELLQTPQPVPGPVYMDEIPYGDPIVGEAFPYASGSCDGACDSIGCDGNNCRRCSPGWWPCITLCAPRDGWVSLEYLLWYQDGMDLPPLVTTSSAGTPRAAAGVLGDSRTSILIGGNEALTDSLSGGRLRFGFWLDPAHRWAVEAEYFGVDHESESSSLSSGGTPILARPFFNVLDGGAEDSELIAFPGVASGGIAVNVESELQGAGFHFRRRIIACEGCGDTVFCNLPQKYCSHLDGLIGYRWLQLDESLSVSEQLTSTIPNRQGAFSIHDGFRTFSQFNGFDFGGSYRRSRGLWSLDLLAKLAIGATRQTVTIDGSTRITSGTTTTSHDGGLLAQRTNSGEFKRDRFSVVPELGATLGYRLTPQLQATLGYTFIYWSNVVRPGDHVSRDLNPNLLPPEATPFTGAERPQFAFVDSDYWIQGISFGGEYRW